MTKLIERDGNLFDTEAKAIGHGVNCQGVMGAGIALAFRAMSPAMYQEYRWNCHSGNLRPGDVFLWHGNENGRYIFNIASQDLPGADAKIIWLVRGVLQAVENCETLGLAVLALPYIGAGIGGLKRADVKYWLKQIASIGPTDIELWEYKG